MVTRLRRARCVRCVVIPTLLITFLSGCYKWSTIQLGPDLPDRVRVTYRSSQAGAACAERDEFDSPVILGDVLVSQRPAEAGTVRTSIPTSNICLLEQRIADAGRSGLALLGVVAGVGLVSLIAVAAALDGQWGRE